MGALLSRSACPPGSGAGGRLHLAPGDLARRTTRAPRGGCSPGCARGRDPGAAGRGDPDASRAAVRYAHQSASHPAGAPPRSAAAASHGPPPRAARARGLGAVRGRGPGDHRPADLGRGRSDRRSPARRGLRNSHARSPGRTVAWLPAAGRARLGTARGRARPPAACPGGACARPGGAVGRGAAGRELAAGGWTASIVALRALGDPDALPAADLGLRRALGRRGLLASTREVEHRAERWRPWRGYATLWLWSEDAR